MSMGKKDAEKKAEMPEIDLWGSGRNPRGHRTKSASKPTVATGTKTAAGEATMEAVVARENMLRALRAVERNAGQPGVGNCRRLLKGRALVKNTQIDDSATKLPRWRGRSGR